MTKNIQYRLNAKSIDLQLNHWFNDNQWLKFIEQFLSFERFDTVSSEEGADRYQITFRFQGSLFMLNIEHLCESAWIEPMEVQGIEKLLDILEVIPKNTI